MKDQLGREIDYLRISVTDRCNLRCCYCMPPCGVEPVPHESILRFDEIIRLTRLFARSGIRKVKITGGEPLVRKGLTSLLREIKAVPGIQSLTLTTNGILIGRNPALAEELASAGVDGINISLDTLREDRYEEITGVRGLTDVLTALDACCSVESLRVKVNTVTLAAWNLDEIEELAALARDRDLDVRFIEMMPIGLGCGHEGYGQDLILDRLTKAYGAPSPYTGSRRGNGPAAYYSFPGFRGNIGLIGAVTHRFCSLCNRVRLTSEGVLQPCLESRTGIDLRTPLRAGADDGKLSMLIEEGILGKPREHGFGCGGTGKDGAGPLMSSIGG